MQVGIRSITMKQTAGVKSISTGAFNSVRQLFCRPYSKQVKYLLSNRAPIHQTLTAWPSLVVKYIINQSIRILKYSSAQAQDTSVFSVLEKKRSRVVSQILQKIHCLSNTSVLIPQFLVITKHIKVFKTMLFLKTVVFFKYFKKKHSAKKRSLTLFTTTAIRRDEVSYTQGFRSISTR